MKTFATSVFKIEHFKKFFFWIVAATTKICTRDYLMKVQTLHFIIFKLVIKTKKNLHVILQNDDYIETHISSHHLSGISFYL